MRRHHRRVATALTYTDDVAELQTKVDHCGGTCDVWPAGGSRGGLGAHRIGWGDLDLIVSRCPRSGPIRVCVLMCLLCVLVGRRRAG